MSVVDRILEGIAFLFFFALAVVLVVIALGWDPTPTLVYWLPLLVAETTTRWVIGAAGLLLLVLGVYFLTRATAGGSAEGSILLESPSQTGEVRVALRAVESLIYRTLRQERGVRESEVKLRHQAEGISVGVHLVVEPDISIPDLTRSLQRRIADYVQQTAGVPVTEVRVLVRNVSRSPRPEKASGSTRS
ncbi:MAG: alkaline shock response membrane anchor protein AmaP [Limnochordales bacterium]|nr:alkaline shock response membrane anchor protein AmaP [Limnochordales bacterium]